MITDTRGERVRILSKPGGFFPASDKALNERDLYMFFSPEEQYIELMIAGEGITLATFPVKPENVKDIGEAVHISLGEGRIQFPLPRDSQRIEREREEECFRNKEVRK